MTDRHSHSFDTTDTTGTSNGAHLDEAASGALGKMQADSEPSTALVIQAAEANLKVVLEEQTSPTDSNLVIQAAEQSKLTDQQAKPPTGNEPDSLILGPVGDQFKTCPSDK